MAICPLQLVLLTLACPASALACTEATVNGMSPSLLSVTVTA